MKVKAIKLGYYDHKRIREGQVFELKERKDIKGNIVSIESQLSKIWMEPIGGDHKSENSKSRNAKQKEA